MRLSEIYIAIETGKGPAIPEDQAFAILVAIEHLAQIEGLPVLALDFSAPQFGAKFTFQLGDLQGSWVGRSQYLVWRNLILNAQMRFAPGDVDGDPWSSLRRAERLWKKKEWTNQYSLYPLLPPGTHPRDVTDALLSNVREELVPTMRLQFRAGVSEFRRLFENDLALRTGLLPDALPSPLPGVRNHQLLTRMSPEIEGWRHSLLDREVIIALNYLNRLAIAGHRLNGKNDTLVDLRVAICDLPNPTEVDVPSIELGTLRSYVSLVRCSLGGPDPRKNPAEQAWADLRTAARVAGCETSFLWSLGKPAAYRNLCPWEVSETIALEIIDSYLNSSMPSQCRRGCEQFDALREKVSSELLPPFPLGIRRRPPPPPQQPKPALCPDPVKTAWGSLFARLREYGWEQKHLSNLSYIRVRATMAGIVPQALSQSFIDALLGDITMVQDRTRLRAAVLVIKKLSGDANFIDLPDISPPEDHRFTHGGPSPQAAAELEEIMDRMNVAASTRRSYRVAVGVVTDAMGHPDIPLNVILKTDMSAFDLGIHEPRRKPHMGVIKSIHDFLELHWTPAWQELHRVVAGTGMTALVNPVPKVLSWNPSTDPQNLTKEWAKGLDRKFRSTLMSPPHGRADIAKALARHLAAFDALHGIPEVARTGLLPSRIGPIR